jgi:DNA-binding NarL/FixJ family response regulator
MPCEGGASAPIRVLIVDDQKPFQEAAHALVDATPGFEWIGVASCGEEGVEQVERLRPDLVLMDVRMPGIGGMEAARRMALRGLPATVILISADPDEPASFAGNEAGGRIVSKRRLNRSLLRRLWEDRGRMPGGASVVEAGGSRRDPQSTG